MAKHPIFFPATLCLAALVNIAIMTSAYGQAERAKALYGDAFVGWDGISAYCNISPKDERNRALCEWILQKIRVLSVSTNIETITSEDSVSSNVKLREQKNKNFLDLEVFIQTAGTNPKAMNGRVTASKFYLSAVNQSYSHLNNDPRGTPKPGELVFWQKYFVASGDEGADFNSSIRQAFETILNSFFADFIEARRPN